MRNPGLEPGSLAALEPESSASANSASSAGVAFESGISHCYSTICFCQAMILLGQVLSYGDCKAELLAVNLPITGVVQ